MNRKRIRALFIYYAVWFVPTTTPIYIILHEVYGWDALLSYLLGCLIPATVALPFTRWYAKSLPDNGISDKLDKLEEKL